jgi:subtilisin family serine protease
MSLNQGIGSGFIGAIAETNQPKIASAAVPTTPFPSSYWWLYYPGNVVVQSAGNNNQDACPFAYRPNASTLSSSTSDGVLVVGALNSSGQRASPFSAPYPAVASTEPGSNDGACVDMWAPGNYIYSTWGSGSGGTEHNMLFAGGQPASCANGTCTSPPHTGWAHLSGTSMAAPHVAAAAAYYIDKLGLSTPAQVESTLRSNTVLVNGRTMVRLN